MSTDVEQLSEKFEAIETDTINGDTIRARVTDLEYDEVTAGEGHREYVNILVELPSGREDAFEFPLPQTTSDQYEFNRLLRAKGLTLGQATELIGKEIEVEVGRNGHVALAEHGFESNTDRAMSEIGQLFLQHVAGFLAASIAIGWWVGGAVNIDPVFFPEPIVAFAGGVAIFALGGGAYVFGYAMLGPSS